MKKQRKRIKLYCRVADVSGKTVRQKKMNWFVKAIMLTGGLERIFELVATPVDGPSPEGKNWHQILLKQMAEDIFEIRPAVISDPTRKGLDQYRGFRHVVRNVFTYKFDSETEKN